MEREAEKIIKAKKQLLLIGVICVATVIFVLWLVNLRSILKYNRNQYASPFPALQTPKDELKNSWREFRKRYTPYAQ